MRRDPHLDQALRPNAVLLLCALGSGPLSAQTVRGSVVDSATTRPLTGVTAELLDSTNAVVSRAVGDDSGRFVVTARKSGTYQLQLRRIGYRTALSGGLTLGRDSEVSVNARLPAMPVELAPVRVEAARSEFLLGQGYYRRRESERGTFLDPAQVEKKAIKAKLSTDILVGIPGVSVWKNAPRLRGCGAGDEDQKPSLRARRGAVIYIDGAESGTEVMWSLQPNDILAVEVYIGPAQIPLQYGGTSTPCGIILIWTKH